MPITVHKITDDHRFLTLRAEVAEKNDFKLLRQLFRDLISSRLCIISTFALEEHTRDKDPFRYPLGEPFDLSYDATTKNVSLALGPEKGAGTWKLIEGISSKHHVRSPGA